MIDFSHDIFFQNIVTMATIKSVYFSKKHFSWTLRTVQSVGQLNRKIRFFEIFLFFFLRNFFQILNQFSVNCNAKTKKNIVRKRRYKRVKLKNQGKWEGLKISIYLLGAKFVTQAVMESVLDNEDDLDDEEDKTNGFDFSSLSLI